MEKKYTEPKLNKAKEVTLIPKGSTKAKEQAKNEWYISYSFNKKQYKVKGGINRITDHLEKQLEADSLLLSIKNDLANGYNPENKTEYLKKVEKLNISLKDAITKFLEYYKNNYKKKKTIQSYHSKLKAFLSEHPKALLEEITLNDLEEFVRKNINKENGYAQNTVKFTKRTFSAFFNKMVKQGYIQTNTYLGFETDIKSVKSGKEVHKTYNDKQLKDIMSYLDAKDPYGALFCRFLYHTLLRPSEIKQLKVGDINLSRKLITVRASTKKVIGNNPKDDPIKIILNFLPTLEQLDLDKQNPNDFIFGAGGKLFQQTKVGENTPYNKLIKALEHINLTKQGYDLYSFKHTSNVNRYNEGWTRIQIQSANRHSTPEQTDTYLRGLAEQTDISELNLNPI